MDAVFFSVKRAFHATLRCGRPLLAKVGLTPARFDVLYAIADRDAAKTQMGLRSVLGVARATISEMLGALEELGLIQRKPNENDRRTRRLSLTAAGRELLKRAYAFAVGEGIVPLAVDSALSEGDALIDTFSRREQLDTLTEAIRRYFGDTAIAELYPWHPDEYLSALDELIEALRPPAIAAALMNCVAGDAPSA